MSTEQKTEENEAGAAPPGRRGGEGGGGGGREKEPPVWVRDGEERENGSKVPLYEPRGGLAVLRLLRHREFALFWFGQSISMTGSWMQGFAQGWVVADLTTSAFALGLVNFATSLPMLILTPF